MTLANPLATTYMGIALHNPLIIGAGPLTGDFDNVRELEDAGAAALVLPSLFEEDLTTEQLSDFFSYDTYGDSFPEASSYAPEPESAPGPDAYLDHLRRVKAAVGIPVIGSLNGSTPGGWLSCAKLMEDAGADAVELHLFHSASDPDLSSADVERQMLQILTAVKGELRIPVAVKLAPLFTAFANFALQLDAAGANALVLFTRFHRIDFDVIELEVLRRVEYSTSAELDLRLRGVAALAGRVRASLAITGGVHTALDVIKGTMAGAHAMQLVSAVMRHGPMHLRSVLTEIEAWLIANEWGSLNEMRGNMSYQHVPNPAAYERESFRRMFSVDVARG